MSTARMALPGVAPDAFLQFIEDSRFRLARPEQRLVDLLGTVAARTPDDDPFALCFPFQDGTRPDAQLSPHLRRD